MHVHTWRMCRGGKKQPVYRSFSDASANQKAAQSETLGIVVTATWRNKESKVLWRLITDSWLIPWFFHWFPPADRLRTFLFALTATCHSEVRTLRLYWCANVYCVASVCCFWICTPDLEPNIDNTHKALDKVTDAPRLQGRGYEHLIKWSH